MMAAVALNTRSIHTKTQSGNYVHDYKMYANGKLVYTRTKAFGGNIQFGPDYYFMYVFHSKRLPRGLELCKHEL